MVYCGASVSETKSFYLDRFYFGNLIVGGSRSSAAAGIVARTPNVTPEQATECVQLAKLRPPLPAELTDDMPGALGLFRGGSQSADFIIAKAQRNDAGYPQIQFLLTPFAVLQQLGGNVLALRELGAMAMPSFSRMEPDLRPFEFHDVRPLSDDEQTQALMDLLLICDDSFANIEKMLASIVQGWPLAIVDSPGALNERLAFLQGLLSLLPAPARVGITFATHVNDFTTNQAQITFSTGTATPEKHVVYDWTAKKLLTSAPQDAYSHYIAAQLRLEPAHVVQETTRMARTAVWRAMQRENLSTALEWVSRRAALDLIVRDGQPADRQHVAAVLREDPTLPDDLRQVYIRHLLAFTLALKETSTADVIAAQCASYPSLAQGVSDQLTAAIASKQALQVYSLLERWILRVPECTVEQWQPLLHAAAKAHLTMLLDTRQNEAALTYLNILRQAPPTLHIQSIMTELVHNASQAARTNTDLARRIFLLAAEFMPSGDLFNLLSEERFIAALPMPLQTAIAHMQDSSPPAPPPTHLLYNSAQVFGDGYRMLVLTRLVELAVMQQRADLIDTPSLQALLVVAQSRRSEQFQALIQHVVDDLSQLDIVRNLDTAGKRILIQLTLQARDYEHAIAMLEYYQNTVYGIDNLDDFTALVGELFRQVSLPVEEFNRALNYLENSKIRPGPRAMIYTSALINRQWQPDLDYAARQLTTILYNDYHLISVIGRAHVLNLLDYHAKPRNALDTLRVAAALIDNVIDLDIEGAVLITRMWPLVTWNDDVTSTALELLRRYVRGIPMRKAPEMISFLSEELGAHIGKMLYATYVMRFIVQEADLLRFNDDVKLTAELLIDMATVYHADKDLPTIVRLRREVDMLTGGLNDQERAQVAENLLKLPAHIYDVGVRRVRIRGKQPYYNQYVQGLKGPQNGLELLHFIGGHFGHKEAFPLDLNRNEMAHLFGTRSAAMLLRETNAVTALLDGLNRASEQLENTALDADILRTELDSLWDTLSLYNKRQIQESLARNCQYLSSVIAIIAQNGSERALGNTNIGRQLETGKRQPQTTLDAMRWIHGYFARKHMRV